MSTKQTVCIQSALLKIQADLFALAEIAKTEKALELYVSLTTAQNAVKESIQVAKPQTPAPNEYYWQKY